MTIPRQAASKRSIPDQETVVLLIIELEFEIDKDFRFLWSFDPDYYIIKGNRDSQSEADFLSTLLGKKYHKRLDE